MNFSHYLSQVGHLYFEGAVSNFDPNLLRCFGGSLILAGQDAHYVRVEENAVLWFDTRRDPQEMWNTAHAKWRRHEQGICALLQQGHPPSEAVYLYLRSHGTYPHTPTQVQQMLQPVMDATGSQHPAWMDATIQLRRRIQRGARVMTNTFGAITTMTVLALSSNDWQHATPAEWNRAMNAGEIGILVGKMAGAHTGAHGKWMKMHHQATARTH